MQYSPGLVHLGFLQRSTDIFTKGKEEIKIQKYYSPTTTNQHFFKSCYLYQDSRYSCVYFINTKKDDQTKTKNDFLFLVLGWLKIIFACFLLLFIFVYDFFHFIIIDNSLPPLPFLLSAFNICVLFLFSIFFFFFWNKKHCFLFNHNIKIREQKRNC